MIARNVLPSTPRALDLVDQFVRHQSAHLERVGAQAQRHPALGMVDEVLDGDGAPAHQIRWG